jgi:hypothetical protein
MIGMLFMILAAAFGIAALATFYAVLASIIHFEIFGALVFTVLTAVFYGIARFIIVTEPARAEVRHLKWVRKHADRGNADFQCYLGAKYEEGDGVFRSLTQAAMWYRKAADQGDASAQCRLGCLYMSGGGVDKDYVQAYMWIYLANVTHPNMCSFSKCYGLTYATTRGLLKQLENELMIPAEVFQAEEMARNWKPLVSK